MITPFRGLEPLEPRLLMSAGPFTFADEDGDRYTVVLRGAGNMSVSRVDAVVDGTGPIDAIELTGTDETSVLSVTVRKSPAGDGIVTINKITADSQVKSIRAAKSDLVGEGILIRTTGEGEEMSETRFFMERLKIRDLLDGADIIAGGDTTQETRIKARAVADGSDIDLTSILRKLTVASFGVGMITAPSAGGIHIKGDAKAGIVGNFMGDVDLFDAAAPWTLGSMKVANATIGASVRAVNTIKSFSTGTIIDSDIFAGIDEEHSGLPDSADDFVNKFTGRIGSAVVRGLPGAFDWIVNSNFAAWRIGKFKGGFVMEDNGDVPFGLALNQIRSFTYTDEDGTIKLTNPHSSGMTFDDGDATIAFF